MSAKAMTTARKTERNDMGWPPGEMALTAAMEARVYVLDGTNANCSRSGRRLASIGHGHRASLPRNS